MKRFNFFDREIFLEIYITEYKSEIESISRYFAYELACILILLFSSNLE